MIRRAICGQCLEECLVDAGIIGEAERGVYRGGVCPHCHTSPVYQYNDPPTGPPSEGSTTYRQLRIPGAPVELG